MPVFFTRSVFTRPASTQPRRPCSPSTGIAAAACIGLALLVFANRELEVEARAAAVAGGPAGERTAQRDAVEDSLPLGSFLDRLRSALARQEAAGGAGRGTQTLRARVTAESRSGVRRLRIRDHQLLSDSDRGLAGYDLGAGSWDTEVGVLGSAVASEFLFQAAAAGIALEALDVVFTSHQEEAAPPRRPAGPGQGPGQVNYPRNLQYTAYVVSPATDAQLETLRLAVERASPVFEFVSQPQDIAHGTVVYTPSAATPAPDAPPGLRDFLVEKRAALLRRQETAARSSAGESGSSSGGGTSRGSSNSGSSASSSGPPSSPGLRAHVRVEAGTGLRRVRVGDGRFQFLHDNPRDLAGFDLGPTVEEHQLGVMGTCLTHIFEIQAAQRQVVLDALAIEVEGRLTPRRGPGVDAAPSRLRDVRYTVHITSPASEREIDDLRKAVEAVCPIYNLLKDPQPITGRIVRERFVAPVQPPVLTAGPR